jgi:sec-independent protein translocase protein TatC
VYTVEQNAMVGTVSPGNIAKDPEPSAIQKFMNPGKEELPDDFSMPIWDHLEELRERVLVGGLAAGAAILTCFCFSKDLVVFLEAPVISQVCRARSGLVPEKANFWNMCLAKPEQGRRLRLQGVKFLQLSPGEFFFTTLKVSGYAGLLIATPTMLYEVVAYILPGLTKSERKVLAPVIFGSSILFYIGLLFSYEILTPAALTFFVSYADGAVESFWSIDQYFEFVLVLMLSTGLAFQVCTLAVVSCTSSAACMQLVTLLRWRCCKLSLRAVFKMKTAISAAISACTGSLVTHPWHRVLCALRLLDSRIGACRCPWCRFCSGNCVS